jgi:hypothetical protein
VFPILNSLSTSVHPPIFSPSKSTRIIVCTGDASKLTVVKHVGDVFDGYVVAVNGVDGHRLSRHDFASTPRAQAIATEWPALLETLETPVPSASAAKTMPQRHGGGRVTISRAYLAVDGGLLAPSPAGTWRAPSSTKLRPHNRREQERQSHGAVGARTARHCEALQSTTRHCRRTLRFWRHGES